WEAQALFRSSDCSHEGKRLRGEGDSRTVGARKKDGHSAAIVAFGNTGRCPCFNADYDGLGDDFLPDIPPSPWPHPPRPLAALRALRTSAWARVSMGADAR